MMTEFETKLLRAMEMRIIPALSEIADSLGEISRSLADYTPETEKEDNDDQD